MPIPVGLFLRSAMQTTSKSFAQELKSELVNKAKNVSSAVWQASLNNRKKEELAFHNKDRNAEIISNLPKDTFELLHGNKKYYSTTQLSRAYVESWIKKNCGEKIFLDYACGNGAMSLLAAQAGAALSIGIDISDVSIQNCQAKANSCHLSENTLYLQGDCENTGLPDNSVDIVICSGMLHHLDLSYAFPELRRILKPGGKVLAVEALNYNPVIKLYREFTPQMRTKWEKGHILSMRDVSFAQRFFEVSEVHFWHLFSILGVFIKIEAVHRLFNALDRIVLKIPIIRLMAWQFTFVLSKRNDN